MGGGDSDIDCDRRDGTPDGMGSGPGDLGSLLFSDLDLGSGIGLGARLLLGVCADTLREGMAFNFAGAFGVLTMRRCDDD